MKSTQLAIVCLATLALAVGCRPPSETPAPEARPATARQFDQVRQDANQAAQPMTDYAYAHRAEYVATRQAELAEINRDLDQLAAKIERANDAAKTEATPRLQALREQAVRLNTHLDEAKNATESTWDDVKAGFNQGYSDLKNGFEQARRWVSEKIDP